MGIYAPHLAWFAWAAIGLVVHIARHGEPNEERHNGFIQFGKVVALGAILWAGGFFGGSC